MNTTKNLFKFAMLAFAALLIVTTSCDKDDDEVDDPIVVVDNYALMTDYLKANTMDLTDVATSWTISAHDLDSLINDYYVIDLRASADYTTGHIPGSVNTTLANILTEAGNSDGKPIVVVCYTGQTASHGHVALRLSGYTDSRILLFGMSSWNVDFDSWSANIGDVAVGHTNWSTTNTIATNVAYSLPTFTSSKTAGQEILEERVQEMLDNGLQGVTNADVLATPTNYFINNYWASTDVDHYGHIKTAYRIQEDLSLAADGFKNLDKDATIVTYCWTSQTSSLITAYLNILGYDAKSLKFGANGMIHTALQSHKWIASGDYTYE